MKTTERVIAGPAGPQADALIERARRRQRHRRWVIVVAAAAVLAVVVAVMANGGGGTGGRVVAHGGKHHPAGAGAVPKLGVRWQAKVPAGVISITAAYGS